MVAINVTFANALRAAAAEHSHNAVPLVLDVRLSRDLDWEKKLISRQTKDKGILTDLIEILKTVSRGFTNLVDDSVIVGFYLEVIRHTKKNASIPQITLKPLKSDD